MAVQLRRLTSGAILAATPARAGDRRAPRVLTFTLLVLLGGGLTAHGQATPKQKRTPAATQKTGEKTAAPQGTATANAQFDEAAKRADEARISSHLDEAIEFYTKALKIRPQWPDGWWYLGAIYYEKDLYPQAQDAFNKLVALDPEKGQAWGMLGLCAFQTGDYERAVVSLQRGRTLGLGGNQELETVVRYHTALLYIHFQQFEIAYEVLREFLKVGNESPKIADVFGLAILRMPVLPKDIPADKRELVALAGQAGLNMAARRLDQARKFFDTLLSRYPAEPNVHYSFGVFQLSQDADAALKEFQRALELSPLHQPAMVQMAFEYLKRDEYEKALPLAEKAVQLDPKMYPARNVLGRVLLELGQADRAVKELEEGVRLAPSSPEMHFALARAYTRIGRKADAQKERETFKRLQDEYERQRNVRQTAETDKSREPAKP
jgi:tetratricopeptide (TPR) repeat protein